VNSVVIVVGDNITTWTHIPTEVYADLKESLNNLTAEIENTPEDSTKAQRNRRDTAHKNCEKLFRLFVKHYLRNPFISDDYLIKMGITPHGNNRSPRIDVSETVDFVLHTKGIKNVIVDFWQTGTKNKAKPVGCDSAMVLWTVAKEKPLSDELYSYHKRVSRRPFVIEFSDVERGSVVWIKCAWMNYRGNTGRFSDAKSTIIP